MRIYYAHDKRTYGTPEEKAAIEIIKNDIEDFKPCEVFNPHTDIEQNDETPREIMKKCIESLLTCDVLVFSAYKDKEIRGGVFTEIKTAKMVGIPVFWLKGKELISNYRIGAPTWPIEEVK